MTEAMHTLAAIALFFAAAGPFVAWCIAHRFVEFDL